MRSVEKGTVPTDANGQPKQYSEYQQARPDLISRLGEYCSFCEGHIAANLAVEHILPKNWHPQLELSWDNFLIACTNCNSTKGNKDIDLADYYWPHQGYRSIKCCLPTILLKIYLYILAFNTKKAYNDIFLKLERVPYTVL